MSEFFSAANKDLIELASQNADTYQTAAPFPNIFFDNFFDPEYLSKVLDEFPDLSAKKEAQKFANQKEIKLAGKGERFFGTETKKLMHFLNSEPFLNFLQILTGIEEPLIGDPYYLGGGQHEIKRNGLLKVHADFNKHAKLDLDRRINVLVYLNKDWKEEYGGNFELWNQDMTRSEKKILPIFNRMAIFSTTDFSYHGHPDPLNCPEDRSRKSLALYYYSNGRPSHEVNKGLEKHSTLFKARQGNEKDDAAFNQTGEKIKNGIKTVVKELTPPIVFNALKPRPKKD